MKVSVLLVTFDHEDEIDACLDGALNQDGVDVEVVVLDNASSDKTLKRLRKRGGAIKVIASKENIGFARGVNEAFAASTGALVLLLNPDVVMAPGCLNALVAHLEDEEVVGAAALLRNPDGSPQQFARRDHGLKTSVWAFTDLGKRFDAKLRKGRSLAYRSYAESWEPEEPLAVDVPACACVLLRREDLAPRPMDPAFPLFFNDADLFRRLRSEGRVEVVPTAHASHGYGTSVQRAGVAAPAAMRAEWVASLRVYTKRHWSTPKYAALEAVLIADAVTTLLLGIIRKGNRDHARGTLGGLGLPGGAEPLLTGKV